MDVRELKDVLGSMAVREQCYAISDGLKIDALVLYKKNMVWDFFYYREKGERIGHRVFKTESEACLYLLDRIKTR